MKTTLRMIVIVILIAACISSESLSADFGGPAGDGWHTWRVAAADVNELQIYVSIELGEPVRLRVRGNSVCSDAPDVEATDLGLVEVDQSIGWLKKYITPRSELSSDALMAIALHPGDHPVTVLASIVKFGTDRKIREEALFWLGQSDSDGAFAVLDHLLSGGRG